MAAYVNYGGHWEGYFFDEKIVTYPNKFTYYDETLSVPMEKFATYEYLDISFRANNLTHGFDVTELKVEISYK